jgi:hypothetical protein
MALRGLPPFLPFSRAARALIADLTAPPIWPPRRPSATACGFLRFMRDKRSDQHIRRRFGFSTILRSPAIICELRMARRAQLGKAGPFARTVLVGCHENAKSPFDGLRAGACGEPVEPCFRGYLAQVVVAHGDDLEALGSPRRAKGHRVSDLRRQQRSGQRRAP